MNISTIDPSPPSLDGVTWRPVTRDDLAAVVALAQTCYSSDGGIHSMFEPDEMLSRFFPDGPGTAIGALHPDGALVACNAVTIPQDASELRATSVGHVRPDVRGQGLGSYLMRWSRAQAESRLPNGSPRVLRIRTESLTDSADHLYLSHGFQNVFEALVMGYDLHDSLPDRHLPPGVTITEWRPDLADQFFQTYQAAFRDRPGFPGYSAEEWISGVTESDNDPAWTLLAYADGAPAGFVIGNIDLSLDPAGGHIAQVGVVPAQRRRGLSSALLAETMRRMQAAGAPSARLEVHTNNPGAIRSYEELGFVTIGRRARYERTLEL